jgi:hypothetical protein
MKRCGTSVQAARACCVICLDIVLVDGPALHPSCLQEGATPLHRAAQEGHKDVAALLLDRRADPHLAILGLQKTVNDNTKASCVTPAPACVQGNLHRSGELVPAEGELAVPPMHIRGSPMHIGYPDSHNTFFPPPPPSAHVDDPIYRAVLPCDAQAEGDRDKARRGLQLISELSSRMPRFRSEDGMFPPSERTSAASLSPPTSGTSMVVGHPGGTGAGAQVFVSYRVREADVEAR